MVGESPNGHQDPGNAKAERPPIADMYIGPVRLRDEANTCNIGAVAKPQYKYRKKKKKK